ncbi:MAG: hypothetical protein EG828_12915, partial [Deltaproteobacteria bacterium]|nr:hypothetical protein [Deltaproteobacteria bacterium]
MTTILPHRAVRYPEETFTPTTNLTHRGGDRAAKEEELRIQTKRFSPRYLYLYMAALAALLLVPALASAVTMSVKVTTDKASYAPGQPVKVTAYAVYSDGKPVLSTTKRQLSVKNPIGVTVFKATLASTGNGYYSGSYTLAATAPAGTWEAKADIQDPALIKA